MNPLGAVIGGVLLAGLLFGSGYITGHKVAEGESIKALESQRQDYQKKIDARDIRVQKAAEDSAQLAIQIEIIKRTKTKEVISYVQTAAAAVVCLDDRGLRAWNSDAQTGAGQVQPGGLQSGSGGAEHVDQGHGG